MSAIIGTIGWTRPARLIRGVILSAKEREYVYASRGFGASPWWLITRHCLPETYGVILTQAALLLPQFILAEVTLSFLGLGVAEPAVSWGSLLAPIRQLSIVSRYWWMTLPVVLIVVVAWGFAALEDLIADYNRASAS
jgi:peptide/nickel transport system permease protein